MKKILIICLLVTVALFTSCKTVGTTHSVTFKVGNKTVVTEYVKDGESFNDFPEIRLRKGYSVVWETASIESVTKDVVIIGREVANEYQIILNASGGEVAENEIIVVYESDYELSIPKKDGFKFVGWFDKDGNYVETTGKWYVDSNLELTARYTQGYTLTFKMDGQNIIVVGVNKDEVIAESKIPTIVNRPGYTARWSVSDFSALVNVDTVINAIYTPNMYKIIYELEDGCEIESDTQSVAFGAFIQKSNLYKPKRAGYIFDKWVYAETGLEVTDFTYQTEGDLHIKAVWKNVDIWSGFYW